MEDYYIVILPDLKWCCVDTPAAAYQSMSSHLYISDTDGVK